MLAHLERTPPHLPDLIHQMDRKPNRLALVRQRPFDRLLNPPSTIRTQLATLSRIEAFYGLNQTDISFRNQIEERQPEILLEKHFSNRKSDSNPIQNADRRSRCKRNKWQGPARSAGRKPFMPDCFLTAAERSGNQQNN